MIYTLTLNPAVDYVVHIDKLSAGQIMRGQRESVFFGGKGINVSLILHELGVKSVAMGFTAGFTGAAIEDFLTSNDILCDFVYLKSGFSRINVKIRAEAETDINGSGPDIKECDIDALFEKLSTLQNGDTLVLAGSVPSSLPQDIYGRIMESLDSKNIRFVVDTAGEKLLGTLKYHPFLIKPNLEELSEIFSTKISTADEALKYAELLQKQGARNVLISMGEKGAVLLTDTGEKYFQIAYSGITVNTVGAGDSTVAGFISGIEQTGDFEYALKLGTAAGSATAFSEGLADREHINALLNSDRN